MRKRTSIKRVAVFRALFLGDLIVSLPALQMLRDALPGAEISLIGLPWAEEIIRRTPALDRLLAFPGFPGIREMPYDQGQAETFLAVCRAAPFDLAIQMHGSGEVSNGFVASLGARATLGYAKGEDPRLTVALPWKEETREIDRWLRLVDAVTGDGHEVHELRSRNPSIRATRATRGAPGAVEAPRLSTADEERRRAESLLADLPGDGPLVGLHAGAKDEGRRWPAERFAALADQLWERHGARLVLTGAEAERGITAAVAAGARAPIRDLAGQTGLGELIALVGTLDLLVTNDTGASHVASTTRTPSVVLFGPSRPQRWGPPDSRRHRALDSLAFAIPGADPAAALRALPVGPVAEACERQLALGREVRRGEAPWKE